MKNTAKIYTLLIGQDKVPALLTWLGFKRIPVVSYKLVPYRPDQDACSLNFICLKKEYREAKEYLKLI